MDKLSMEQAREKLQREVIELRKEESNRLKIQELKREKQRLESNREFERLGRKK